MGGHRRNAAPVKPQSTFLGVLFVNYCLIEPHLRLVIYFLYQELVDHRVRVNVLWYKYLSHLVNT